MTISTTFLFAVETILANPQTFMSDTIPRHSIHLSPSDPTQQRYDSRTLELSSSDCHIQVLTGSRVIADCTGSLGADDSVIISGHYLGSIPLRSADKCLGLWVADMEGKMLIKTSKYDEFVLSIHSIARRFLLVLL